MRVILLADDDADDQQLLTEAVQLTDPGFSLFTVSSAREAMAYLDSHRSAPPSLIILDYNMPDNNGAEVLDMLRSLDALSEIPVLVWSTSDSSVYKRICEEKGARAYFQKPTSFRELLEITRHMIGFASA